MAPTDPLPLPRRRVLWMRYAMYAVAVALLIVAGRFLEGLLAHPAAAPVPDTPPACALEGFCAFHPISVTHPPQPAARTTAQTTATAQPGTPSAHYHEETVAQLLGKGSATHPRSRPG